MNRGVFGFNNFDTKDRPPLIDVVLAANQSISNTTETGVLFDTVITDTHQQYQIGTGVSRIVTKVPGYYLITGAIQMSGTTTLIQAQQSVRKNGNAYRYQSLLDNGAAVNLLQTTGATLVPLAIGDTCNLVGWINATGTLTFQVSPSTWMQAIWMRPL